MKGCGAGGWAPVAAAPIPPEVCLILTIFHLFESLAIVARVAHFAQILCKPHEQASADVKLGFSASDVAAASKKVVEATHSARQPELFLEVRACVDRALPWCDKVRSTYVTEPSSAKKAGALIPQMRRLRRFFRCKTTLTPPLYAPSPLSLLQHPTNRASLLRTSSSLSPSRLLRAPLRALLWPREENWRPRIFRAGLPSRATVSRSR